jgi:hypothetical protein
MISGITVHSGSDSESGSCSTVILGIQVTDDAGAFVTGTASGSRSGDGGPGLGLRVLSSCDGRAPGRDSPSRLPDSDPSESESESK